MLIDFAIINWTVALFAIPLIANIGFSTRVAKIRALTVLIVFGAIPFTIITFVVAMIVWTLQGLDNTES